ncbi:MAG TPA: hypothetical protein VLX61_09465 [Anaerolineales bacterium]|nr:hypothetical protein [Anaerolineales bacterium]
MDFNKRCILIPLLINLGLSIILFGGFSYLPHPQLMSCTYSPAENLILAVGAALVIQSLAFKRSWTANYFWVVGTDVGLILLALWLGSYATSPVGFSSGRIPVGQGFVLTRAMRPDENIASGETVNVVSGSAIALRAITLPVGKGCFWVSTKNGSLDDPRSCDIAYMPPSDSDFDLLKVLIQPSCRLPEAQENIKIVVLP